MFAFARAITHPAGSMRGRARRGETADGPRGATIPLRRPLYVAAGPDGEVRGRAVAVAVDEGDTRYLVEEASGDQRWVAEDAIERISRFAPGDAVIGYIAVDGTARSRATRGRVAAVRRAADREGWRVGAIACDDGCTPISERPGLRRALERIRAGEAAGLVVAEFDCAAASAAAAAELLAAVRDAGGGVVALGADDLAGAGADRRRTSAAERTAARRRIDELRATGMTPRAIADVLNSEGVPTLGPDPLWRPWSVRNAGGAWPSRGPSRRRPRP